ncbi:MAG TPA: methyl-accepting chemotaxis protein [bacterium]|nr:methyl-accepting chemotaxis protein [bacterium]
MGDHERRRQYLINKGMQLKYVGMLLFTIVVVNFIVGLGIYVTVWRSLQPEYSKVVMSSKMETASRLRSYEDARFGVATLNRSDIDREATMISDALTKQLQESFNNARLKIIPVIVLLLIIIFLEGVFLSNRIAGPIYHAEKSLRRIREGDLAYRTFFRKHDEFKDLYKEMNLLADDFQGAVLAVRPQLEQMKKNVVELQALLQQAQPELARKAGMLCAELSAGADRGLAAVGKYRTEPAPRP